MVVHPRNYWVWCPNTARGELVSALIERAAVEAVAHQWWPGHPIRTYFDSSRGVWMGGPLTQALQPFLVVQRD